MIRITLNGFSATGIPESRLVLRVFDINKSGKFILDENLKVWLSYDYFPGGTDGYLQFTLDNKSLSPGYLELFEIDTVNNRISGELDALLSLNPSPKKVSTPRRLRAKFDVALTLKHLN